MTIENRIEALNVKFQPIAEAIRNIANAYVFPLRFPGFKMRITETKRDDARQAAVNSTGASDVKRGWHNVGLAFDFGVLDDQGVLISDGGHPAYEAVGLVACSFGCKWPIILANGDKDAGHIEYHPGFTLAQYDAAMALGTDLTAGLRT